RFNGAASARSRKPPRAPVLATNGCSRFNGAASARSRKRKTRRQMQSAKTPLQWGRERSLAETIARLYLLLLKVFASMGPRALARGNPKKQRRARRGREASM